MCFGSCVEQSFARKVDQRKSRSSTGLHPKKKETKPQEIAFTVLQKKQINEFKRKI